MLNGSEDIAVQQKNYQSSPPHTSSQRPQRTGRVKRSGPRRQLSSSSSEKNSRVSTPAPQQPRNVYRYDKLPIHPESRFIRVIELLPRAKEAPLVCRIKVVNLDEKPDYETISYCWGPPVFDRKLIIEDQGSLSITKSLQGALRQLRDDEKVRTLWADAVSINQQDVEERNAQVQLMRDIYSNCQSVVAWLGEADTMSDVGMETIQRVLSALRKKDRAGDLSWIRQLSDSAIIRYGFPQRNSWTLHCLFSIFERPWFRRVWIIQELALGPRALLMCGNKSAQWNDFCRVTTESWGHLVTYSHSHAINSGRHFADLLIEPTKQEVLMGQTPHLLSLVARSSATLATDARDKVFALVGLSNERGIPGILGTPNYMLTIEEVYTRFAAENIQRYGTLDVLSLAHRPVENPDPLNLPSWVPDLRESVSDPLTRLEKIVLHDDDHLLLEGDLPTFTASGKTKTGLHFTGRRLHLSGIVIDAIAAAGDLMHHRGADEDAISYSQRVRNTFASWEAVVDARAHHRYPATNESRLRVYWQTMHGGMTAKTYETCRADFYNDYILPMRAYRLLTLGKAIKNRTLFQALERVNGWLLDVQSFLRVQCAEPAIGDLVVPGIVNYRRMGLTAVGRIGLLPGDARVGDQVVLFKGGRVPFVIRRREDSYQLIGEAYVHGVMYGEAWEESACLEMCLE